MDRVHLKKEIRETADFRPEGFAGAWSIGMESHEKQLKASENILM
jgi:hypothetical protein